jgi:hypothetical protein
MTRVYVYVRKLRFIDWIRQVVRQIVCVCGENNIHVDTISSPTCSTTCCTTNRTVCGPLKALTASAILFTIKLYKLNHT